MQEPGNPHFCHVQGIGTIVHIKQIYSQVERNMILPAFCSIMNLPAL